jgi:hypothetical protein
MAGYRDKQRQNEKFPCRFGVLQNLETGWHMFLRNEPDPLSKNPGSWLVTRSDRREAVGEIGRGLIGVSRLAALQRQRRPYLALTSSSTVAGAVQKT